MAIFHHVDQDGDSVEILAYEGGEPLALLARSFGHRRVEVDICREAAIRLHNAIGEWLYPTGVRRPPEPMTPADLRAMVAGQVAEIMALRQTPQAKYVDASAESDPEPDTRCPGCTPLGCTDFSHDGPMDPEPHDVGHPEPAKEPLPVRSPLASFVQLLTGVREAQAEMTRLTGEALAKGLARPRPEPEPDAEDGGEPVKATWDDELFSPEGGQWTMCPCPQTGIKGIQCPRCGHIHHTAAIGCTARVRRVQS